MKISKIEFENFRNFKEHGEIRCSTDGKVTIIYGKNGDGKTTLHQLFQWIFYGQVRFNKTTTDRLYNLEFESEQSFGDVFQVMGRIDFEHDCCFYSLTSTYIYKKGLDDSEKIGEDISLNKMDGDNNWKRMERPRDIIEKLLPSGLSEYFFFDGESMIADLRVKGRDSAVKLRKALYSMFDLDVLEAAVGHIGKTELKTTVLGSLYLGKSSVASGSQISSIKTNIENAQNRIESIKNKLQSAQNEKKEKKEFINNASEEIGNTKSKADYENQRRALKYQRDVFIQNTKMSQSEFGDAVMDMFPQLLIAKAVHDAKQKIHLRVEKSHLPDGINKRLIHYLLALETRTCICGNELCEAEKQHISEYLKMMPPKSYTSMYSDFSKTAKSWKNGYDREKIEAYIRSVLTNSESAASCDQNIRALDEAEKKSRDIEGLIVARQKAEDKVEELDVLISDLESQKKDYTRYLRKQMEEFDKVTRETSENEKALKKISIMQLVLEHFSSRLEKESVEYSKRLEENIQDLLNQMLTSKRRVTVSSEFSVRVTDSFNDESKSEGQFAVVSFAYIGGILKMLRSEQNLASKEYPLVLDGPFSKLDPDQRQNVINMIPEFAPQVILFSKDDLQDVFENKSIGHIWTIMSNEEKNVARVEEGYKWN